MNNNVPVLMIGLDAMEATLIEKLCADGKLPTLGSLRERGCFGLLESDARSFAGGVWPTFYTSKRVPWHGIYHNKLWRCERMRCEVPNKDWRPVEPFWESLGQKKYRIALIDVPTVLAAHKTTHGIHLVGWGTHDIFIRESWPSHLWRRLRKDYGPPITALESFGPQDAKSLLNLRANLIETTDQMAKISGSVLASEPWDLFLVVFGAPHRGGHYLWDLSQIHKGDLTSKHLGILENALADIYQACDRALAQLIEKAPDDARIIVFAVHGMGPNQGWSDYCAEILSRIHCVVTGKRPKEGFLYELKRVLPWQLMRQVTQRLPESVSNRLVELWSSKMLDWGETRFFPLPMDHAGYIRINLRGRETQGIVEGDEGFESLCQELEEAFLSFRDLVSNEPIVDSVYRIDDLAPLEAPYRKDLPDLVITWRGCAIRSRGILSHKYGQIRLNSDGRLPSGRSGNHREKGWFVAVGDGIRPGLLPNEFHVLDLVPTVYRWLNVESREGFQGRPIQALCEGH